MFLHQSTVYKKDESDLEDYLIEEGLKNTFYTNTQQSQVAGEQLKEIIHLSKKTKNLNKFLTINGCKHYNLKFDNVLISYVRKKDYLFQKYSKFRNDSLINYNHFKNYWSKN